MQIALISAMASLKESKITQHETNMLSNEFPVTIVFDSLWFWYHSDYDLTNKPSQMGFYQLLTCNGEQKYPWRLSSSCSQSHLDFLGATRWTRKHIEKQIHEIVEQNLEEKETIAPLFSSPAGVPASRWLFSLQPYSFQPHTVSVCYPDWCSGSEQHLPEPSSVSLLQ